MDGNCVDTASGKKPRRAVRRAMALLVALAPALGPAAVSVRAEEAKEIAAKPAASENPSREESVLVSLSFTSPAGVENDIAREHNLELVSRLALPTVGLRVVRYTIPDGRPVAAVLARLREDRRVSAAQLNFEYRQDPDEQETVVGSLPKPLAKGPAKSAARASLVRKEVARTARERRTAELFGEKRPVRRAKIVAADVLAGGL